MDLREPKKKRIGSHIKLQQHLPIFTESESGLPVASELWPFYTGHFTGDCVMVCNVAENISLYSMGFFGKGSFSRGYPAFGSTKAGIPPTIKERQWQRRKSWIEKITNSCNNHLQAKIIDEGENLFGNSQTNKTTTILEHSSQESVMEVENGVNHTFGEGCSKIDDKRMGTEEATDLSLISDHLCNKHTSIAQIADSNLRDKVLVLADSDDEDIDRVVRDPQPHIEDEPVKTAVETLNLTLEEAFFLQYALGCLQVIDMSGPLTILQTWQKFCEAKSDFIESYIVYHYFRSKGWVVKSGHKFGGDFLLYKQGPPFYHASYIVLVEKVDYQKDTSSLTWTKLHGLNRLAENSGKEIIISQVVFPNNLISKDISTPKCLPRFQVNEILIRRWVSSQERIEKEEILNTHCH